LAERLKAPVAYSFKGKQRLEHNNPQAVGMTGLLGYGDSHAALHGADVLLTFGSDFPYGEFLPEEGREDRSGRPGPAADRATRTARSGRCW
jgi:pyruvate dehydrogenase (quinone)